MLNKNHAYKYIFQRTKHKKGYLNWASYCIPKSCKSKVPPKDTWNCMSVEEGEDLYHVRKITKVHFRIFRATILPPFDTLFSNEYNFFSIGCLLRLKKYVIPLLILFGMKKILMYVYFPEISDVWLIPRFFKIKQKEDNQNFGCSCITWILD